MRGKANRLRLDSHSRACFRLRQPARFCSSTRAAASAKVGTAWLRRFSARGVSTLTGELAVGQHFLPGLGQRDQGEAAETELPAAATDDEALNPATGSVRLDKEVEAIPVGVSSGRGGAEERGRKGLWGMAAGELGPGEQAG